MPGSDGIELLACELKQLRIANRPGGGAVGRAADERRGRGAAALDDFADHFAPAVGARRGQPETAVENDVQAGGGSPLEEEGVAGADLYERKATGKIVQRFAIECAEEISRGDVAAEFAP